MADLTNVTEAAHALASAIARRDLQAVASMLDADFVLRTPGGPSVDGRAFVSRIGDIPGEIIFVRLENLHVDTTDAGALVTGVQHAQVRIDARTIDERRPFVDWFVRERDGAWRVKVALELPAYAPG